MSARIATHPGEILRHEFMEPMGVTPFKLAPNLHVPLARLERLRRCQIPIDADWAIRLGIYFGTSREFWINLQNAYDFSVAERHGYYRNVLPMVKP